MPDFKSTKNKLTLVRSEYSVRFKVKSDGNLPF